MISSSRLSSSVYRPRPIRRGPSSRLISSPTTNYTSFAPPIHPRITPVSSTLSRPPFPASFVRFGSSFNPWKMNSDIEYRELKPITDMPSDDVLLIDVREESEVIQGNIPSSVNMPMSVFEKTLDKHPDEFLQTVGFRKPRPEQKIVFYCRSGARSARALDIARLKGFKNVRNYKGSWLDWIDKENSA
ncbi:uncharacterized protein PGTG_10215 [Puccinia graminis f. sp. tritici CRL 75-36-700-3]|uniref:Rhodanese domain-containing protein n=1 Tax=Puccinia graminis f. sp. tritici (strain CRL 75-36-700-3 / race SCCL) TaxID=418459 RepID=E3KJM0_PUCGT|nr:uncharacterized protein PGTG_10215 [Puccinia graminis f. sp. tritici CRL 75-36-700-3]EFP84495.1 hypothetical protein PGTG_10215 [Puccinia graminis f. sp. tritici CRL 75-36-700-3]